MLELGGKCPVYVADDAHLDRAAKRITFSKWCLNNGQTCVAADYVMASDATLKKLIPKIKGYMKDFFGGNPETSLEVSRMINKFHTKRVGDMLREKGVEVIHGGKVVEDDKYIEPTMVSCGLDNALMKEEIFGPVLPMIAVPDLKAAIKIIQSGEKPLASYIFTSDSATEQAFLNKVSAGGACVNEIAMHVSSATLPFGGVGHSGMGAYHGKAGFDVMSHQKAVYKRIGPDPPMRFPPFSNGSISFLRTAANLGSYIPFLKSAVKYAVALVVVAWFYKNFLSRH